MSEVVRKMPVPTTLPMVSDVASQVVRRRSRRLSTSSGAAEAVFKVGATLAPARAWCNALAPRAARICLRHGPSPVDAADVLRLSALAAHLPQLGPSLPPC